MQNEQGFTRVSRKRQARTSASTMRKKQQHSSENHNRKRANKPSALPGKPADTQNLSPPPSTRWADRVASPEASNSEKTPAVYVNQTPTFNSISEPLFPYPFAQPPHLLLTGRYSESELPENELVFRRVFEPGQLATRELLQQCRQISSARTKTTLGIALQEDQLGDPITIITKRIPNQTGLRRATDAWMLTGDVRIRFPSPTTAHDVYEQQMQQTRRSNGAGGLTTYDG